MVIWRDIAVPIREKQHHIRKLGGRIRHAFINTFGDVPVAEINETTRKIEEVVNTRGRAYAARRRLSYRLNRKKEQRAA